jgi:hypothetical protein
LGSEHLEYQVSNEDLSFSLPDLSGLTFAVLDFQRAKLDSEMALAAIDLVFDPREPSTKLTGSVNYWIQIFSDVLESTSPKSERSLVLKL